MRSVQHARLICHPTTPCHAVRGIDVRAGRSADGQLTLTFGIDGDLGRVRLPPSRAPRFATELWQHTCLEAFIARDGAPAYHEYNLAPSGEWALYAFRKYREGGPIEDDVRAPRIEARRAPERFELDAAIRLDLLAPGYVGAPLRLGLSGVVEEVDGLLSYWALSHPAERPDFHHAAARTMRLAPPEGE